MNIKGLKELELFVKEYNKQPSNSRIDYKCVTERVKDIKLDEDDLNRVVARVVPRWDLFGDSHKWLLRLGKKFIFLNNWNVIQRSSLKIVVIDYDFLDMRLTTVSLKRYLRHLC